jgi:hypothetical protein
VIYRFALDPVVHDSASSASSAGMFNDLHRIHFSSSLAVRERQLTVTVKRGET